MAKRNPPNPMAEDAALDPVDVTEETATPVEPVSLAEPDRPTIAEPQPTLPEADPSPPRADEPPLATASEARRSGGFLPTALGGVVAAAAGYALSVFVPFPYQQAGSDPVFDAPAEVQALSGRIAALEAAPADEEGLSERIAALESRPEPAEQDLSGITAALAALERRIVAVETRAPAAGSAAAAPDVISALEDLRAEVDAIKASGQEATAGIEAMVAETKSRLAEAQAQADAIKAEAEETSRKARAAAAVGRVQAALESGAPFASALADLDGLDVPPALSVAAETGIPSRAAVEAAFPAAARSALEASLRADMGSSWSERFTSFLQSTTGARSLTPREGDDPDAVLSRAEAAVRDGKLDIAMQELQALPPEGLAAMSEWIALAQQRQDAAAAAAALSAALEG